MRSTVVLSFAASCLLALPALAQESPNAPPRPPGQIGPTPANPLDTGFGTTTGTNTGSTPPTVTPTTTPSPSTSGATGPGAPSAPPGTGLTTPLMPTAQPRGSNVAPLTVPRQSPRANVPPPPPGLPSVPQALMPVSGGLTADLAARRALEGNYAVIASEAQVAQARAAQSESARSMIPSLQLSGRYTRLSEYSPGSIPFFNTPGCLLNLMDCTQHSGNYIQNVVLQQPILDQFAFRATVTIPLTDIPFRLLRFYEAAGLTAEARALDVEVSRAQAGLSAREAFYDYMRAVGQAAVAQQGVETAQRRHDDIARAVEAGTLARADLLRAEASLADLNRLNLLARNGVDLAEAVLRQRLHLRPEERVQLGEGIEDVPAVPANVTELVRRAWTNRPEVQSIDRQVRALNLNVSATEASMYPSVAVVGNVDIANPNPRIFPQTQTFTTTWDANVQVSWSPTAAYVAGATVTRLRAQRAQILAQQQQVREGFELEVRTAHNGAQAALAQIEAARTAVASAEENYRVRRERVAAGAATQTDLIDAETELLRSRLAVVNAIVDLRVALARLRRAVGEREVAAPATRH
jgi:outer membrane protein TolC